MKWCLYKFKSKILKNFTADDLKVGTKIRWYNGISTIIEIEKVTSFDKINNFEAAERDLYILDTNYIFKDEKDYVFIEDICYVIKNKKEK